VSVGCFLLGRAEAARRRVMAGKLAGRNGWILGPLAAPYHFQRPRLWRSTADVPAAPFAGIRIWELAWSVEERAADPRRVERRLVLEVAPAS
jgi:hypothetical protein